MIHCRVHHHSTQVVNSVSGSLSVVDLTYKVINWLGYKCWKANSLCSYVKAAPPSRRNPLATRPWSKLSISINASELKSLTSCAVNVILLTLGSTPGHHSEYPHFLTAVSCSGTRFTWPFNEEGWRWLTHSISTRTCKESYLMDASSCSSSHSFRISTWLPSHPNIMFNTRPQKTCLPRNCTNSESTHFGLPNVTVQVRPRIQLYSWEKSSSWIITVVKFSYWEKLLTACLPLLHVFKDAIILPSHAIQLSILQTEGL